MRFLEPIEKLIDKTGIGRTYAFHTRRMIWRTPKEITVRAYSVKYSINGITVDVHFHTKGRIGIHIDDNTIYEIYLHEIELIWRGAVFEEFCHHEFYTKDEDSLTSKPLLPSSPPDTMKFTLNSRNEIGIATNIHPMRDKKIDTEHTIYLFYLPLRKYRDEIEEIKRFYLSNT